MRERFHGQLAALGDRLAEMSAMAGEEFRLANRALLDGDPDARAEVEAVETRLDAARAESEEDAQRLLALQAPVAHDLRTVLATVYCADRIERMGDLARHVAETAGRMPGRALPAEVTLRLATLAEIIGMMADELTASFGEPGGGMFTTLDEADERVDELHRDLMTFVTGPQWTYGVECAVTVALLARFYERFADQAVSVARRLDFESTGELPV